MKFSQAILNLKSTRGNPEANKYLIDLQKRLEEKTIAPDQDLSLDERIKLFFIEFRGKKLAEQRDFASEQRGNMLVEYATVEKTKVNKVPLLKALLIGLAGEGSVEIVRDLLKYEATSQDGFLKTLNRENNNAIAEAALERKGDDMLTLLAEYKINFNALLATAVEANESEKVQRLLKVATDNSPALLAAVQSLNADMVKILIEAKADLAKKYDNKNLLQILVDAAIANNDANKASHAANILQMLIKHQPELGDALLIDGSRLRSDELLRIALCGRSVYEVVKDNPNMLVFIARLGVDYKDLVDDAIKDDNLAMVKSLIASHRIVADEALHSAVQQLKPQIVETLVHDHKLDLSQRFEKDKKTFLHVVVDAIRTGGEGATEKATEIASILLAANPELSKLVDAHGDSPARSIVRGTPLDILKYAKQAQPSSLKLLKTLKADFRELFALCCAYGDISDADFLRRNAFVTADDINSSLRYAISSWATMGVQYLLDNGAVPRQQDYLMHELVSGKYRDSATEGQANAIFDMLHKKFPKLVHECNGQGETPLVTLLKNSSNPSLVQKMLMAGSAFYPKARVVNGADSKDVHPPQTVVTAIKSKLQPLEKLDNNMINMIHSAILILLFSQRNDRNKIKPDDAYAILGLLSHFVRQAPEGFVKGLAHDSCAYVLSASLQPSGYRRNLFIDERDPMREDIRTHQGRLATAYLKGFGADLDAFLKPADIKTSDKDVAVVASSSPADAKYPEPVSLSLEAAYKAQEACYETLRENLGFNIATSQNIFGDALLEKVVKFFTELDKDTALISHIRGNILLRQLLFEYSHSHQLKIAAGILPVLPAVLKNAVKVDATKTIELIVKLFLNHQSINIRYELGRHLSLISSEEAWPKLIETLFGLAIIPFDAPIDEKLVGEEMSRRESNIPLPDLDKEAAKLSLIANSGANGAAKILVRVAKSRQNEEKRGDLSPLTKLWNTCQDTAKKYPLLSARMLAALYLYLTSLQHGKRNEAIAVILAAATSNAGDTPAKEWPRTGDSITRKIFLQLFCELLQLPKQVSSRIVGPDDLMNAFRRSQPAVWDSDHDQVMSFMKWHMDMSLDHPDFDAATTELLKNVKLSNTAKFQPKPKTAGSTVAIQPPRIA